MFCVYSNDQYNMNIEHIYMYKYIFLNCIVIMKVLSPIVIIVNIQFLISLIVIIYYNTNHFYFYCCRSKNIRMSEFSVSIITNFLHIWSNCAINDKLCTNRLQKKDWFIHNYIPYLCCF